MKEEEHTIKPHNYRTWTHPSFIQKPLDIIHPGLPSRNLYRLHIRPCYVHSTWLTLESSRQEAIIINSRGLLSATSSLNPGEYCGRQQIYQSVGTKDRVGGGKEVTLSAITRDIVKQCRETETDNIQKNLKDIYFMSIK